MTFTAWETLLVIFIAMCIGFAKTGVSTLGILQLVLMATIIPAKEAVGFLLPMLIAADLVAVTYYRRHVDWKILLRLSPWVTVGIGGGYFVLEVAEDRALQLLLGIIIISLILLQIAKDRWVPKIDEYVPKALWFSSIMGVLAGFATMIGNVSSVVMAMYLIGQKLSKKEIVGTGAWFFLFVNLVKVPFYIRLGMITVDSALFNVWLLPGIALGTWGGIKFIPRIPQVWFQRVILIFGFFGGLNLLI